jgi:Periplasmic copper-binding protein (NosD)
MRTKLVAVVITVLSASFAVHVSVVSAQSEITSCQTISVAGKYNVGGTLNSSGCLVITASNVTINVLPGATIQGTGESGAGVHVMSGATNFTWQPDAGVIRNYSAGIELESTGAWIENNFDDPECIENVSAGVLIKNTSGNIIDAVATHAQYNGIWIQGGGRNVVSGYESSIQQGFSTTDCSHETVASDSDGIRIDNSSGNLIYQVDLAQGTSAGVHIVNGSKYNNVVSNLIQGSGVGISIKADGSGNNFIFNNTLKNNQLDEQDNNPNCDRDFWLDNTFTTSSPSSCAF